MHIIPSFIPVHEEQCAWASSEYVALSCGLQVVSSDLFNSIFTNQNFRSKAKEKKKGKLRKENESFWRSYTISVKPDSRKSEPEKKKVFLSIHFN